MEKVVLFSFLNKKKKIPNIIAVIIQMENPLLAIKLKGNRQEIFLIREPKDWETMEISSACDVIRVFACCKANWKAFVSSIRVAKVHFIIHESAYPRSHIKAVLNKKEKDTWLSSCSFCF